MAQAFERRAQPPINPGASVSLMSELLPEPLTPEMPINRPKGNVAATFFRLFVVTPSISILRDLAAFRRCDGSSIFAPRSDIDR